MITVLSSPKPGSGVSTTAALLALAVRHETHTHVVDLCGDQTALLGVTTQPGPTIEVTHHLTVHDLTNQSLGDQVAVVARLARLDEHVIIDAGTPDHPIHDHLPTGTIRRWVLRPCFLALRRATAHPVRPDEVIVLDELGRALNARDVEAVTGAPVTATVEVHPQIARATDAGLLCARPPATVQAALAGLTQPRTAA
ncbi:MAG: hypothetical protein AB7Q27_15540 [Acidimicrobiia bacterium]